MQGTQRLYRGTECLCRKCGKPLELDRGNNCFKHRTGTLLNSLSPSRFPHCDVEQSKPGRPYEYTAKEAEAKKTEVNRAKNKRRKAKKQAKLDSLK